MISFEEHLGFVSVWFICTTSMPDLHTMLNHVITDLKNHDFHSLGILSDSVGHMCFTQPQKLLYCFIKSPEVTSQRVTHFWVWKSLDYQHHTTFFSKYSCKKNFPHFYLPISPLLFLKINYLQIFLINLDTIHLLVCVLQISSHSLRLGLSLALKCFTDMIFDLTL